MRKYAESEKLEPVRPDDLTPEQRLAATKARSDGTVSAPEVDASAPREASVQAITISSDGTPVRAQVAKWME